MQLETTSSLLWLKYTLKFDSASVYLDTPLNYHNLGSSYENISSGIHNVKSIPH